MVAVRLDYSTCPRSRVVVIGDAEPTMGTIDLLVVAVEGSSLQVAVFDLVEHLQTSTVGQE